MKTIEFINQHILWGVPMLIVMLGTGLHMTAATKGMIFRRFGTVIKYTAGTIFSRDKASRSGSITPFQAVSTALAATVGTGNIAGVSAAIAVGGPGAVFWMWIPALLGMVTKYCEVTLAVAYRSRNKQGETVGGAMYYIANGLGRKNLAIFFSVCGCICALGIGNMVQVNSLTNAVNSAFGANSAIVGIITALLAAVVLSGGIKRIASSTEILVPFMAAFYIMGTAIVLCINADKIPEAFALIFKCAFTDTAARGGFAGASVMLAMRIGTARGVFTNEAGLGSAPTAHSAADTDHPSRQGLWGAFEVFLDTLVMCTLTALAILTSGVWTLDGLAETEFTQAAFAKSFNGGGYMVTICLIVFAFETIIAWYYYGEKFLEFITGGRFKKLYLAVYLLVIIAGSVAPVSAVWELADMVNGLMALPNLLALNLLAPTVSRMTEDFFATPNEKMQWSKPVPLYYKSD